MATKLSLKRKSSSKTTLNWLADHWLVIFLIIFGLWVWIPWLAPFFMHAGLEKAGNAIYFVYKFFCHQLPERSFFLFGQRPMYSLPEIEAAWKTSLNPLVLRQFIGSAQMGWKVAWSDRMISFYTSIWLFGLLWWFIRRMVKPLPWWGFALLLLPMALDGGTHLISDFAGIDQGFRETNQWLAVMTNHLLPISFYTGNALGSFNSWMRLFTGLLAGLGVSWFVFPLLHKTQTLDQELVKHDYGKVLEQIRNKDPRFAGR
jgi:uncharacterized membrane protein